MTSTDYLVDIVNKIKDPANQWGQNKLAIWGGRCAEDELLNFLQDWPLTDMPYRIWEYVSEIEFSPQTTNQPPKNVNLLEHSRVFGPGGDLTIRRDGAEFRWHFVGKTTQPDPPAIGKPKDFWEINSGLTFHKWKDEALLWGKYTDQDEKTGNHRWHDDRVARATLEYPIELEEEKDEGRVRIIYWTFSRAGQVQFVWFRELAKWKKEA